MAAPQCPPSLVPYPTLFHLCALSASAANPFPARKRGNAAFRTSSRGPRGHPDNAGRSNAGRRSRRPILTYFPRGGVLRGEVAPAIGSKTHGNGSRPRSARSGGPTDRTGVAAGLRTRRPQFSVTLQAPGHPVSGRSHGPAMGCQAAHRMPRGIYWLAADGQARPKPRAGRDLAAFILTEGGRPGQNATPNGVRV